MNRIELISVPVTDQEKAKEFYMTKMGFSLLTEAPFGKDQKWIQLGIPGTQVSITLVNWFPNMKAGSLQGVVIHTHDLDADAAMLAGKGVSVGNIDTTPWGRFASFQDQDGNGWILHQE